MVTTLDDGSLQGLFLKEGGGVVRVEGIGSDKGLFTKVKINKKDVIMTINGVEVHSVKECEDAIMMQHKSIGGDNIIPILTYNVFRKAKSTMVVEATSNSAVEGGGDPSLKVKKRSVSDAYEMGKEVSGIVYTHFLFEQIVILLPSLLHHSFSRFKSWDREPSVQSY